MYKDRPFSQCVSQSASNAVPSLPFKLMFPLCGMVLFLAVLLPLNAWGASDSKITPVFNAALAKALEQSLQKTLAKNNITGAVLAVRSPDNATWKGAAGYAVLETKTAMQTDLHFRIGSVTKTFTSTLILMLVDQGKLQLYTTVDEVVPELKIVMGDVMTIENLLEMRSGLQNYLGNSSFMPFLENDPGRIWTPEEIISFSNKKASAPGTTFLYNNGNYVLLGLIIEKITGKTYAEALRQYIIDPLKLNDTSLPENLNMPTPYASGYQYGVGLNLKPLDMTINATYYINPKTAWSSGALVSNEEDLLTWAKAYFEGALISDALHKKQFDLLPVPSTENPLIDAYGLGAMRDGVLVGHDGFIPPYGSWVATYKNYEFVLLINGTGKGPMDGTEASEATADVLKEIIVDVFNQL